MKRELKFRAWDGSKSEMYELKTLWLDIKYRDEISIMQFTGLKDKNGKEIYEGDLIRRNGHIRKVVFDEGSFCLWGIKQFEGTLDPMTVMFHGSALYNFISDIEVIGNVFETPELSVGKEKIKS